MQQSHLLYRELDASKSKKSKELKSGSLIAFDIETWENGDLRLGYLYDGCESAFFSSWDTFFDILNRYRIRKTIRLVAHNGGGFDFLHLLSYIIKKEDYKFKCIAPNSKLIALSVDTGGRDLLFIDSMNWLPMSLETAGQKLLGRGKSDIGGKMPWELDTETCDKYCLADTILLYDCVSKLEESLLKIAPSSKGLKMTLPSTALDIFNKTYKKHKIEHLRDKDDFFREGYKGGRVEVFRYGEHKNVNVYDINSLYPYIMSCKILPYNTKIVKTEKIHETKIGCYKVRFKQRDGRKPVLAVNGKYVYEGEGTYYSPELWILLKNAANTVEILEGYYFVDCDIIFKNFVDRLYPMRADGEPWNTVCKLLLNSTYGKYGQKDERSSIVRGEEAELKKEYDDVEPFLPEFNLYKVTEEKEQWHTHVAIAGAITSWSRAELYAYIDNELTIYCDTDSIHTTGSLPTSTALGALKLEAKAKRATYAGRKLYGLDTEQGEKLRIKGVSLKKAQKSDGSKIGYADFEEITKNSIETKAEAMATLRETLKGAKPCTKNQERKRTVKKT